MDGERGEDSGLILEGRRSLLSGAAEQVPWPGLSVCLTLEVSVPAVDRMEDALALGIHTSASHRLVPLVGRDT